MNMRCIITATMTAILVAATPVFADDPPLNGHQSELQKLLSDSELLKKKTTALVQLLALQKQIVAIEVEKTNYQKAINKTLEDKEIELKTRNASGKIRMLEATIVVLSTPQNTCNAIGFMNYHCAGKTECAPNITRNACLLLATQPHPSELRVTYQCGANQPRNGAFRLGFIPNATGGETPATAFLTCY